jgi:RNA polymerase sigma-70 factor (ECF subfamily)
MEKTMKRVPDRDKENWAIKSAKLGQPAGFQILYELYRSYVYSVCLRMTHEPALSEDLTQDIFLQVLRKINSYKEKAQFRTWLHRVAVNMVLVHFRRHREMNVSLNDQTLPATEVIMAERRSHVDPDTDIALRELLSDLSPNNQNVLMLHDLEGYRHEDISRLLGITSGASRSLLSKVRLRLRIALGVAAPARCVSKSQKVKLAKAQAARHSWYEGHRAQPRAAVPQNFLEGSLHD